MVKKRFWISTILAWLIFIGIDFLFHASILKNVWNIEVLAIRPLQELALLIPLGYSSFLLLTLLIGYLFNKIYKTKPKLKETLIFATVFGILYSLSSLLGTYSYINIPLLNITLNSAVSFIEIIAITIIYYNTLYTKKIRKKIWTTLLIFISLIISGIIIQNIL